MATAIEALLVLCVAYIADRVTKRVVVRLVTDLLQKTSAEWDDALLRHRVVHRLSRLAPAIVIYLLALPVFGDYVAFGLLVRQVTLIYMVLVIVFVIDAGLNAAIDILRASPLSKEIPVKSFVQVLKLVIYGLAAIAVLSLVLGRSPVLLFSGLGAMTAVLMLVSKTHCSASLQASNYQPTGWSPVGTGSRCPSTGLMETSLKSH
ncbi:MAG: hypothetical protein Ct9H300mP25_10130 [Acidobacteriota bacterium]|nr:MAG: hypothetical protein Ct9H300mP25_10130 [Acidobacteriota bacterium]